MTYYIAGFTKSGSALDSALTEKIFQTKAEGLKELKSYQFKDGDAHKLVLYGYDEETETGIAIASLEKAETSFGKLLKEKRQKAEMTQQEVADLLDVPLVTYQRWELDIHYPEFVNLLALINLFKLDDYDMQKTRHKFTKLQVI
jgi:DNA-binding XRE family transcriptional regulator